MRISGLLLLFLVSTSSSCMDRYGCPDFLSAYRDLYETDPTSATLTWFKDAGYGLFIHYGLYSLAGKHPFLQFHEKIPVRDYEKPTEICFPLNRSWGYVKGEEHAGVDELIEWYEKARSLRSNLLVNIGPYGDGSVVEQDIATLEEFGLILAEANPQPNVIFILADDLGWKDVGFMGNRVFETPNLDALAERGQVFTQGYTAAPMCTPTRASIMTGKYPCDVKMYTVIPSLKPSYDYGVPRNNTEFFETGNGVLTRNNLPLEEITIAERLKSKGYRTCYVGKWHLGHEPYHPVYQGFDIQIGTSNYGSPPSYFFPYETIRNGQRRWLVDIGKEGKPGEYLTDRLTDEAIQFIKENRHDPFFLSLNYHNPHSPWQGKPEWVEYYRKKMPDETGKRPTYAAMVHVLDENVGRLVRVLDELGLDEKTLVIFTSDNGGYRHLSHLESLKGAKGSLYEGGIRVPVIISYKGEIEPGRNESVPVSTIDYLPTILAFAGIEMTDPDIRGKNLKPALMGDKGLAERSLFWYFPQMENDLAIRKGKYKLIKNTDSGRTELYDLVQDPSESNNLRDQLPETTERLNGLLEDFLSTFK